MNKEQAHIFLRKTEGAELSDAERLILDEHKSDVQEFEALLALWEQDAQNTEISMPKANWSDVVDRSGRESRRVFMKRIFAAAAIIALALGLNWFYTYRAHLQHDQLVLSGNGPKSYIHQASGAQIDMEAGSSLTLLGASDLNFHGSAEFMIPKQDKDKLRIRSGNVQIEVIGTRFRVDAPENSPEFVLELYEGILEVTYKKQLKKIEQGTRLRINRSKGTVLAETLPPSDVLEFRSQSLERICLEMQEQFGIKISIDPSIDSTKSFTLALPQNDLKTSLELLAQVSGCKVLRQDDGTFALIP